MCTAMPRTCPPTRSSSPVCSPERIWIPSGRAASVIEHGTADCAGRPVERGEEAVAGRAHLAAAEAAELAADRRVVLLQQVAPAAVAELGGVLGRVDDVGEEDGGQHTVGRRMGPYAGQELLDLIEDRAIAAATACGRCRARRHRAPGSARPRSGFRPGLVRAVQDQGRHADRGQHVSSLSSGKFMRISQQAAGRARPAGGRAHH